MSRFCIVLALLAPASPPDPELVVAKVAKLPSIDGKASDEAWAKAAELVVTMGPPNEANPNKKLSLKAVHDGTSLCLLLVWSDEIADTAHKDYSWSVLTEKYHVAEDAPIEDCASIGFGMEGTFNPDMLAPVEAKWDVWEWCALRSSGGHALDKWHLYSKSKPAGLKARQLPSRDESDIYIARVDDEGTLPYKKLNPPGAKGPETAPQFAPQAPSGSAADVEARAVHADGKWTLELKRKLRTGMKDDVQFDVAKTVPFAVATFDAVEHADHDVSGKLLLRFQP